ncbi:MAG: hypothetical protein KDB14_00210, partial [Planctomycetales bacterium]|nr:hypothetical protein [Planctomycetales bacterium]
VAELEGRVPSVFNLVYGYPGALLLLIAGLIAAHCRYEAVAAPSEEAEHSTDASHRTRRALAKVGSAGGSLWRRETVRLVAVIAVWLLASLGVSGWVAAVGQQRIARLPQIEFVLTEHRVERPDVYLGELLASLRSQSREHGRDRPVVLSMLLVPPSHFLQQLEVTHADLARALANPDVPTTATPAVVRTLAQQFEIYRQTWDGVDATATPLAVHEVASSFGGLWPALLKRSGQGEVALRAAAQDWEEWQAQFLMERTWESALEMLRRRDVKGFVRQVLEHRRAVQRHAKVRRTLLKQLRATLPRDLSRYRAADVDFVYVQQPVIRSLSTATELAAISDRDSVERGLVVGTRYLVEELLRRARVAAGAQPREALQFASETVATITLEQVLLWWTSSSDPPESAAELLAELQALGWFKAEPSEFHLAPSTNE